MKRVAVELAMLVRMTKRVVVSVPDGLDLADQSVAQEFLGSVWEADDGDGFAEQGSWGCEEATHALLGEACEGEPTSYRCLRDGSVKLVARRKRAAAG
jgi:hypothetical protein